MHVGDLKLVHLGVHGAVAIEVVPAVAVAGLFGYSFEITEA